MKRSLHLLNESLLILLPTLSIVILWPTPGYGLMALPAVPGALVSTISLIKLFAFVLYKLNKSIFIIIRQLLPSLTASTAVDPILT